MLSDISGNLYREKGVHFEVCSPQGHSAHGKVERMIRTLQESLSQSGIEKSRCTATGWMTVGKAIEHEVNNLPIGYLYDRSGSDGNPVLRMLRPNSLKGFGLTDRAPCGLFSIPNSPVDLMSKIEELYDAWYHCWAISYVPLLLKRQKWKIERENLNKNDVIYFKMAESPLGSNWKLGKVEDVKVGKDGCVREVRVAYKIMNEDTDGWRHATVVRPVRECIKLFELGDTSFMENMEDILKRAEDILMLKKSKEEDVTMEEDQVENTVPEPVVKKKRSSEVEKLKLNGQGEDLPRLRSQKKMQNPFISCSSLKGWNSSSLDRVHVAVGQRGCSEAETFQEENDLNDNYDINDEIMFMI